MKACWGVKDSFFTASTHFSIRELFPQCMESPELICQWKIGCHTSTAYYIRNEVFRVTMFVKVASFSTLKKPRKLDCVPISCTENLTRDEQPQLALFALKNLFFHLFISIFIFFFTFFIYFFYIIFCFHSIWLSPNSVKACLLLKLPCC